MREKDTLDQIQGRLLALAALFLSLYALALTLSPAGRARSWEVDYRWEHWLGFALWLALFILIHMQTARFLPERDPYLIPVAALLCGWGLLTIWRLFPAFGLRQTFSLLVVSAVFVAGLRLPGQLAFLRRYKYLWLSGGLALTALTLIFGTNPAVGFGPRLWLGCCGLYFQPSEPLKLLLIVYLAAYLADRQPFLIFTHRNGKNSGQKNNAGALLPLLSPTLFMTGLTLLLLLVQRDLGTASIFIFIYAVTVYVATNQLRIVLASGLSLALAGVAGYALFDVVRLRVDAWFNPWLDPSGRSYQIVQSIIAIANGGLLGRGPGLGNPALVPIPHSDFIFSAILEESGLLGAVGLLTLLALLAARGMHTALNASDGYRRYLAAGLTAHLVAQSVLIAGGNLRLLPLTGVTLPLVSYGGSSLLTSFLSLLILLHISNRPADRVALVPNTRPYLHLGGFLLSGLGAVSLIAGWWAFYRGPDLLERTDNPRRAIADRYVRRGTLLDRHNEPLADTSGPPGELTRQALYPQLGPIIGYTNPIYGQSGLEASLDPYLRGLRGNPSSTIWWNHLLYGQPPPGVDVRLSLDLDLQRTADQLLRERPGALVLLNAQTGEILAMASHPTYDPNRLDENWPALIDDPRTPLFNRATLGRYQVGSALGPLLLVSATAQGELPPLPETFSVYLEDLLLECAREPIDQTWEAIITAGCPEPQAVLGLALGEGEVLKLLIDLGFYSAPPVSLATSSLAAPDTLPNPERAYLGQADLGASPLQMALAVATLSTDGVRPAPRLAMAVNSPQTGWTGLPPLSSPTRVYPEGLAASVTRGMVVDRLPVWQTVASTPNGPDRYASWYLAGTLPTWNGAPLALVVLLEEDNPALAEIIGQAMLQSALRP